jgi:puromycin-sensitive aminopeptidase
MSGVTRRRFLSGLTLTTVGATAIACRSGHPASSGRAGDAYRLPRSVVPQRYDLRLEPDLGAGRFTGEETVDLSVREPVTEIVLNALDLDVRGARIQDATGRTLPATVTVDGKAQRLRLRFPEPIAAGRWRLSLTFAGALGDRLLGFYRIRVHGTDGVERMLAVTQFQSTDARRAFPCWDEPAFKAVFAVTLVIDQDLTALSNGRPTGVERLAAGKKAVVFAPTVPMSTYLVAFVIGDLEATDPVTGGGTPLRIWALRGKLHLARFAREFAPFALRFFRDYYGVPCPGEKLDLIAVPDFDAGAMENLGAVLFRETKLLVDEKGATVPELMAVTEDIGHEIAHMWFGDLVTMSWWNGLWLNEAFAVFMAMLAVDAWKPEWKRWDAFGAARGAALEVDGLEATRPVEFEVDAPADAEAMFDVLTYQKGAAVLRMLEQHLGPEAFRDGVRRYLAAHQYGNAEAADLWRALGGGSGRSIAAIMDGWVLRPGYPVVTVTTEDGGRRLVFSQRRFGYQTTGGRGESWNIPIVYKVGRRGGGETRRLLLATAEARVTLPAPAEWVVVNVGGYGFYRVQYGPGLLDTIAARASELLGPAERFNLVNDAWAASLAGLSPVADYLELTARFRLEPDRNVWSALLSSLAYLDRVVGPGERAGFEALVRDRLGPAAARLGWAPGPTEDDLVRPLRADLLRVLGTLGNDAPTQATAVGLYERWRRDRSAADPSILPALVAIRAHTGDGADHADMLERSRTAPTPQEQQRYVFALAGFRDPALVRRTLELVVSGTISAQHGPLLVQRLLLSPWAGAVTWDLVKQHWGEITRQYALSGLIHLCEGVTGLATPELEADVRRFFTERRVSLGGMTLPRYLEQLHVAVSFRERAGAALTAYLARQRRVAR